MNTKLWLTASALVMGAAGLAGTFMPHELLAAAHIASAGNLPLLVQLLAALLFAFAMSNWTARGSAIGGIYNRPLAIGNLTHFTIGALALAKAALAGHHDVIVIVAATVYVIFAIGFAAIFFSSGTNVRADVTV